MTTLTVKFEFTREELRAIARGYYGSEEMSPEELRTFVTDVVCIKVSELEREESMVKEKSTKKS
jgi:hypothetical protein